MRFPVQILSMVMAALLLLGACTKGEPEQGNAIGWSVVAPSSLAAPAASSRALVEGYGQLRDACTETPGQELQKIGLFGSCTLGGAVESVFDNTDLWWWSKTDGNPYKDHEGNFSNWNYAGENRNWTDNADYLFKAYFPKSKADLHPSSGAEQLLVMYDAAKEQYDLLVAHKALPARGENPVVLQLEHPLAALKFDFILEDEGVEDRLLECWLENLSGRGIYISSTLNYSGEAVWPQSTPVGAGVPMYLWEPVEPLKLESGTSAVAYSTAAAEGALYSGNGGWILVVPQRCHGPEHVRFCFRTERGGSKVYSVGLPAQNFAPGYRYSYHVKFSSVNVGISVKVSEWNTRKSSYEVDFN